ncbi:MAG: arylsulfatase [Verrucomicrobiota bacterium]
MNRSLRLLLALPALLMAFSVSARQPNVVLILADDLGPGDLGPYGQTKIKTPNLDRMAAEGMKLTQHYCGNAVCAPSRSVLMSGMHPGHTYIRDNRGVASKATQANGGIPETEGQHPIPDEANTMAEVMRGLGYATGGFGKWGLGGPGSSGDPLKQGFQRWFGYNCQGVAHNFYPTYLWDNDKVVHLKNPFFPASDKLKPDEDPAKPESYARFQGAEYSADLIAEQARAFVRQHKDEPFFLYWPTTVPHVALQVPDDSLREYAGQWDDPPYPGGNGYLPHFKPKAAYAAMITRMDREIGSVMNLVNELGLDENTIFIFISDNGPLTGTHAKLAGTDCDFFNSNQGLRDGKGTLFEGGIRSPGIVKWKGKIKAGSVSDRVSGFEDWLPTLVEVAGARDKAPTNIDGISLAPTLIGEKQPAREFLYREFAGYGGQLCVRKGKWKLIKTGLTGKNVKMATARPATLLYDLSKDEKETTNIAAEHREIVAELEAIVTAQHARSTDFPIAGLDK